MKLAARALLAGLAFGLILAPPAVRAADAMIYRIELASGPALFARTPPVPQGARLVFTRHPDGAVVSVKRAEVKRVISVPTIGDSAASGSTAAKTIRNMKPGEILILGPTGGGSPAAGTGGEGTAGAGTAGARPGETRDGRAMFNPGRDYRPEWDARQVPGQNVPFPASPGDYREGRSFAYPPGTATQSAPGQPPTGVPSGPPPQIP